MVSECFSSFGASASNSAIKSSASSTSFRVGLMSSSSINLAFGLSAIASAGKSARFFSISGFSAAFFTSKRFTSLVLELADFMCLMRRSKFAMSESENSAPFSIITALNSSNVLCFSDNAMMNSARSLSLSPKWFSNSVHTFETNERCSSFSNSSMMMSK